MQEALSVNRVQNRAWNILNIKQLHIACQPQEVKLNIYIEDFQYEFTIYCIQFIVIPY